MILFSAAWSYVVAFWHAPPRVSRLICICILVICVPDDKILNKESQAPLGIRCYFAAQQYYLLNANGPEEAEIRNPEHKMFLETGPNFPRTIKCFAAEPSKSPTLRQSVCCLGFQETGQGAQQLLDVLAQCREAFSSFLHPSIVGPHRWVIAPNCQDLYKKIPKAPAASSCQPLSQHVCARTRQPRARRRWLRSDLQCLQFHFTNHFRAQ